MDIQADSDIQSSSGTNTTQNMDIDTGGTGAGDPDPPPPPSDSIQGEVTASLEQLLEAVSRTAGSTATSTSTTATRTEAMDQLSSDGTSIKLHNCLNDACPNGRIKGYYSRAPKIALSHYSINPPETNNNKKSNSKPKKYYICDTCTAEVNSYVDEHIKALQDKKCLFTLSSLRIPNVTIDLDDSDEEKDDGNGSSDEVIEEYELDPDIGTLTDFINQKLASLHVSEQIDLCTDHLDSTLDQVGLSFDATEHKLNQFEDEIERVRKTLEEIAGPQHKQVILRHVDISEDGKVVTIKDRNVNKVTVVPAPPPQPSIPASVKPIPKVQPKGPTHISTGVGPGSVATPKLLNRPAPASVKAKLLQQQQQIKGVGPVPGQICINQQNQTNQAQVQHRPGPARVQREKFIAAAAAIRQTSSSSGRSTDDNDDDEIQEITPVRPIRTEKPSKAELEFNLQQTPEVLPRMSPGIGRVIYAMRSNQLDYWAQGKILEVFKVENKSTGKLETKDYKVLLEGTPKQAPQTKILTGKSISFGVPTPFILPVGSRVIAQFFDEFNIAPHGNGQYYAGIVGELPNKSNDFRYLIFFDDGCVQYVHYKKVLWVCEASRNVYEDVHPDFAGFIKDYLKKYPERPMVRLNPGQAVTIERNGAWWQTKVKEVDGSLVKVYFEAERRYEWIYRGSTRLSPLYDKEKRQKEALASPMTARRRTHNLNMREAKIEYNYGGREGLPKPGGNTARKSTAAPRIGYMLPPGKKFPKELAENYKNGFTTSTIEYEGKLVKNTIPDSAPSTRKFISHKCGPSCVYPYDESIKDYRMINPLQLPFHLGFSRNIAKCPRRYVFYVTPCGLRLRGPKELLQYLHTTKYNLGIDYFTFDFNVDLIHEFVPSKTKYALDDCSFGKETTPISCVNAIDNDFPEILEYSKDRKAGEGVNLNLDENFLVCCDCEDDCADKEKCACWKLTIEGTKIVPTVAANFEGLDIGYVNKRLMDHVVSGIYECNPRCKCKSTCLNRVVQHDLKWQLQVFKTDNKGWAIRPLHDIPIGSFICVYAGKILTEHGANDDGKAYGDEYLAELDYMEVMDIVKEGYEAEAHGPGLGNGKDDETVIISLISSSSESDDEYDDDTDETYSCGPKSKQNENWKKPSNDSNSNTSPPDKLETRQYFGADELCYIMDAKSVGNIGRYLNHSCSPNVFVQNVFVDTHDMRFPWVAFFAFKHIRAGSELTWDYNYDIGSVPGKVMYCYCGSEECRGRLL